MQVKEITFFEKISNVSKTRFNKKNFASRFDKYIQQFSAFLDLSNIRQRILQYEHGDKTIGQLRQLADEYNNLFEYVKNIQNLGQINDNTLNYLEKHLNSIKTFIQKNTKLANDVIKKSKFKGSKTLVDESLSDLSITKLTLNTIPNIIESTLGIAFSNFIQSYTIEKLDIKTRFESDTQKGTSSDIYTTLNGLELANFSVKSKQWSQAKTRQLKSLFDFNDTLKNNDYIKLDILFNFLNSKKINAYNAFRYLIMNYAYLNTQNPSLLTDMNKIILLSSLNEKLFGYNKTGQKSLQLGYLINEFPLAILAPASDRIGVKVTFMSDYIEEFLDSIDSATFKMSDLGTIKIDFSNKIKPTAKNNSLLMEKQAVINKHPNDINYNFIKKAIKGNLELLNQQLSKEINLKIQYKSRFQQI